MTTVIKKPSDRLLSSKEVGEILGLTAETVKRWARQNKIPSIKLSSRKVSFSELAIQQFIAEKRDKK